MNTKTNIQQLAKKLAVRKHMSQKSAETFLREFFDAIIQNVTAQKSVKITGLGSFKLIEVQERESVDVNTGERIVIPGHTKLTFTPDGALKDMVNKPFADFQTVIINEGTNLEEMEKTPEEEASEEAPEATETSEALDVPKSTDALAAPEVSEAIETPDVSAAPSSEEESETEEVSEENPASESEEESEEAPVSESEEEPEEVPAEPEPELEPAFEPEPAPQKVRTMTTPEKWALILGIMVLCVLSYFVGYYRVFLPHSESPVEEESDAANQTDSPEESFFFVEDSLDESSTLPADTVPTDTAVVEQEQVALPEKAEPSQEEAIRPTLVRGKKYQITGTRKTRVMKRGDYLTKIALEEYGEREFAKYIIAHNHFPDPNNVPVGKEILIPELEEVKE